MPVTMQLQQYETPMRLSVHTGLPGRDPPCYAYCTYASPSEGLGAVSLDTLHMAPCETSVSAVRFK